MVTMSSFNLPQLDCWTKLSPLKNNLDTMVIAETNIPVGFHSLPILRPISLRKIFNQQNRPKRLIKAYISELNVVTTRDHVDWIHLVRLAENCFEQNLLIHWDGEKKSLIGIIVKPIAIGEEVKAWLTAELLSLLNIPFLSPANIINSTNYQCNYCESRFHQPNPLKIHLALDCSVKNYANLQHHQYYPTRVSSFSATTTKATITLRSSSSSTTTNSSSLNPLVSPAINNTNISTNLSSPYTTASIISHLIHVPLMASNSLSSSPPSSLSTVTTMGGSTTATTSSSSLSSLSSQETHVRETSEALTNLSPQPTVVTSTLFGTKEPRSHICVFCGKLYTRKYGLKIHLRTHTGHKPLSCRFCGRPFSDPSNLNKHIRLHSQHHSGSTSSPYKCGKCSKILVRRRDLERHLKSRHKLS